MKRGIVLGVLLTAGALSMAAAAGFQSPTPAPKVIEVEKLRDNLFMLKGGGGNTAVFVRSNGVVVVDTKIPGWGQPILDKIKELTDKPVTTIINTHTHFDHVSGNVEFPANVDVVVQENTKTNMQKMSVATGMPPSAVPTNIFQDHNGRGLPTRTFNDRLTLGAGADQIDLYYFGRGHTNGDAWVVFPALRAMHAGDIFAGKRPPLLDANNGGSGVAIGASLAKAAATIKNVDSIITGHSTVMTMDELKQYADFNTDFLTWVEAELKAGKSVDEAAAEYKLPEKYTGYTSSPNQVKSNVGVIYDELKKR